MKLEEKITTLRKRNGWSQEELAFRLDVSRQAVSKWEMGSSVPDIDNVLKMSELFGVSTDYLLKEDGENTLPKTDNPPKRARQVCDEEGNAYLALVKKQSWKIALGVALCILSPVCMFLLLGLAEKGYAVSENAAGGIGCAVILSVCAAGVAFLIVGGIALSKYDFLEKEEIEISLELEKTVRERKIKESKSFIAAVAVSVSLCILSAVPLMISAVFGENDGAQLFALTALFPFVAAGVFLFVKAGMVRGSYSKLLQEEEYAVEKKRAGKQTSAFSGVYWCLATALYLFLSFWTMEWHRTWILWPVAGVLFAALNQIVQAIMKNKKK